MNTYSKTYLASLFAICFICSALGGTVSTLMPVYLPVVVKDLLGETQTAELDRIRGYINALFIFGWAFGGFTWGIICDVIGRKKALLLTITCYGLFTIATGYMSSWPGVIICRLLSGFGVGGVSVAAYTLLSEIWPQKTKAIFIGILSIAFPVGIFAAGLTNYLFSSWREGFLIGVVPLLMALIGIVILKESDKWIDSKSKYSKTESTFKTMLLPEHRRDLVSSSLIYGSMLISLWAIFSWLPTWVQSLITDADAQKERGLSMMLLGMGGLLGGFISGWFVKAIGPQKLMTISFGVCAILSFILFKSNDMFSPIIYLEIGVLSIFFGLNMGIMSAYIPQLFPTQIRATATGFSLNVGRLLTGFAVLFVGVLVTMMGGYGNALLIFSMIFIVGLVVVLIVKPKLN